MACQKMKEDVAYARDTESRCKIAIMLFNFTPIRSPHIFITMPQVARKRENLEVEQASEPASAPCMPVL